MKMYYMRYTTGRMASEIKELEAVVGAIDAADAVRKVTSKHEIRHIHYLGHLDGSLVILNDLRSETRTDNGDRPQG